MNKDFEYGYNKGHLNGMMSSDIRWFIKLEETVQELIDGGYDSDFLLIDKIRSILPDHIDPETRRPKVFDCGIYTQYVIDHQTQTGMNGMSGTSGQNF